MPNLKLFATRYAYRECLFPANVIQRRSRADECDLQPYTHDHCHICTKVCRRCLKACTALFATL
jgi:hypothetical protein